MRSFHDSRAPHSPGWAFEVNTNMPTCFAIQIGSRILITVV